MVITGNGNDNTLNGTATADTISGFGGNDTLNGLGGDDTIQGGAGNDTLTGAMGADTLQGGVGNDVLIGGAGSDSLDGGADSDTYQVGLSHGFDTYTDTGASGTDRIVATANNVAIGLKSGFGVSSGIEEISANGNSNVTILAGSTNDTLNFSGVTLTGIAAINGGAGNDTITGSAGADTILGGDGTDTLKGGQGGDRLDGGEGNDVLTGGAGADAFIIGTATAATRAERITDFVHGVDKIEIDVDGFESFADIQAHAAQVGANTVITFSAGNTLTLNNVTVGTLTSADFVFANDPPILTGDLSAAVAEGGSYVITAGDLGFSDPDDGPSGVTFTVSNQLNGTLKVNNVLATSFTGQQLLNGLVTFEHDGSETATASFIAIVEDGDEDGSTPAAGTFSFTVTPVNDAPTSSNDSVTTNEDIAKLLALSDFGAYSDVEATPIAAVRITTLESDGSLEYDTTGSGAWAAVTLNQVVSASDIAAGRLRFVPSADENGTPYATIGFKVGDGAAFSVAQYTLTVNVNPVDDDIFFDLTMLSAADGFIVQGDFAGDVAGWSVSSAGDVNGDGFDDVIVGARLGDDGGSNAGEAYVVFGKSGGFGTAIGGRQVIDLTTLSATDGFIIQGDAPGDWAGWSVSGAGDINGDGFDDLIVGAPFGDDGGGYAGETYVVFGKSGSFGASINGRQVIDLTTLSAADGFIIQGDLAGDETGYSVASAGDVNGDGFDDVIVGAPLGDDGGASAGVVYVVFGKNGGFGTAIGGRQVIDLTTLSPADGFIIQGDATDDQAGWTVSSAGDVNGDGFHDLIVGARLGDDGGTDAGEAYVVFGKSGSFGTLIGGRMVVDLTTLAAADGFVIQGAASGDSTGWSVSSAGDVNGDGYADLAVGAPDSDAGGSGAGEAYVVFGKSGGFGAAIGGRQVIDLATLSAADGFVIQGDASDDYAGFSVSSAGDVNGDGFDDVIVGSPDGDNGGINAGEAYVVFGKSGGFGTPIGGRQVIDLTALSAPEGFIIQGDASSDEAGWSVSAAGDVNGDGFDDLIVGAPFGDDAGFDAGESYVLFGGDFLGAVVFTGTPGNDTLTGTAAPETFVGGRGDDTLIGNGGADAFQGGAGNDTIRVAAISFARVDGGTGNDKLILLGSGASFDFTVLADSRVQSIEAIGFTGSGNNTLTLGVTDVMNLPDGRNLDFTGITSVPKSLVIDGNVGDILSLDGDPRGAWTLAASDVNLNGSAGGTYDFWVFDAGIQDLAALAIKSDVSVFLI